VKSDEPIEYKLLRQAVCALDLCVLDMETEHFEEIAHFGVFPDKGMLRVGRGDHLTFDVAHQRGDRALTTRR